MPKNNHLGVERLSTARWTRPFSAAFMFGVLALELVFVVGTPAFPRMTVMVVCAGIVPDLIAQRAGHRPLDWFRVSYMAWIGAQVGLAIYAWLPFAVGLPVLLAIVLDQTLFTIPLLICTLVFVKLFEQASIAGAFGALQLGHWRNSFAWRTMRKNWLFWALLAKPLELTLVRLDVVSAVDVVYVDAGLTVVWYTILSFVTHAPAAGHDKVMVTSG